MAYKGPHIKDELPGWVNVDELRDNLVEYMMIQSPYKDLSKEDMPEDMVKELEKSMTRLAIAIFRNVGKSDGGLWDVFVNQQFRETIDTKNPVVNFQQGTGVKIEYRDREDGITLIWSVEKEVIKEIVEAVINPPKPPIVQIDYDYVWGDCQVVGGINTGLQLGIRKEKKLNPTTNLWAFTGVQSPVTRTNLTSCPLPVPPTPDPYFIAVCVNSGNYDQANETIIGFSTSEIEVNSPLKAGDNYLFFSTPTAFGKPKIINPSGKNISYQFFAELVADNRLGFQGNTIWKRGSTFATTMSVIYRLTV